MFHPEVRFGHRALCALIIFLCVQIANVTSISAGDDVPVKEQSFRKENERWIENVESGKTISVVNPYGNVYARFGGYDNELELLAAIQRLDPARRQLEVVRSRDGGALRIEVMEKADDRADAGATKDRIDVVLFVPLGSTLDARTDFGLIEVKGLKSDLIATSLTGNMRLRGNRGRIRAKSARGEISAALVTGATTDGQEFTSETGDIEIYLEEDADMDVHIATSGEITTDFSLQIEHRRFEEPGKYATARVGEGGPKLSIRSKRGRAKLLRQIKPYKPEN